MRRQDFVCRRYLDGMFRRVGVCDVLLCGVRRIGNYRGRVVVFCQMCCVHAGLADLLWNSLADTACAEALCVCVRVLVVCAVED